MRGLRRLLLHNWAWKLGSLLLAFVLWITVVGEPELITVQAAGLYYENLPDNMMITSDVPDSVQIELRGPSGVLARQDLSAVKVRLSLSSVTEPGQRTYMISGRDITLPEGVTFLSAEPARLILDFDRRSSKDVPVQVDLQGSPAPGFLVSGHAVHPATVRVSGPETKVRNLEAARTDAVEVSGLNRSVTVNANTYLPDPQLQLEPRRVSVDIAIERGKTSP